MYSNLHNGFQGVKTTPLTRGISGSLGDIKFQDSILGVCCNLITIVSWWIYILKECLMIWRDILKTMKYKKNINIDNVIPILFFKIGYYELKKNDRREISPNVYHLKGGVNFYKNHLFCVKHAFSHT